jgi:hypothetical protein
MNIRRTISFALAIPLFGVMLVSTASTSQAAVVLPKGSWLPCSNSADTRYCIESVSIIPSGMKAVMLTYSATGTISAGATAAANPSIVTGRSLPGRWTTSSWGSNYAQLGYDGLSIDAKAANDFVPWIYVDAKPTLTDGSGNTTLASLEANRNIAANLDQDTAIEIKLRTGDVKVGVTFGVGTDVSTSFTSTGNYSTVTISGNPVLVPVATTSKDCIGNFGVATAVVRQFQSVIIPSNDPLGFSVEGTSGNLYVGSNGICKLSTPIWIPESKTFKYSASAPRLAPDGKTINTGFYKAVISFADAKVLWGLEKPQDAATALIVSVATTAGGSVSAFKSISARNSMIIIEVSGFDFPDPMLSIALNPDYNMSTQDLQTLNPNPTPTPTSSAAPVKAVVKGAKTATIACVKGKILKKITGPKPVCPKGYVKK